MDLSVCQSVRRKLAGDEVTLDISGYRTHGLIGC